MQESSRREGPFSDVRRKTEKPPRPPLGDAKAPGAECLVLIRNAPRWFSIRGPWRKQNIMRREKMKLHNQPKLEEK